MRYLTVLLCVLFRAINVNHADPCSSYTEIDDYRRSTAYVKDSTPLCDIVLRTAWYRSISGAGGVMPLSAPPLGRCGTLYPIWMDGELPGDGQEVDRTACVKAILSSCQQKYDIKVKNCTTFYVYRLSQTHGCSQAYCFGNELPCPYGETSENGFSPGCQPVPVVNLTTWVEADLVNGTVIPEGMNEPLPIVNKVLEFRCKLKPPENPDQYKYQVDWYFEKVKIVSSEFEAYGNISKTNLQEITWAETWKLGINVMCAMRIKYPRSEAIGPYYQSANFYAGFRTEHSEYSVAENEEIQIKISLTVPVGCLSYEPYVADVCKMDIRSREPIYTDDVCTNGVQGTLQFTNVLCNVSFNYSSWNETRTLNVTAKGDNKVPNANKITFINLRADKSFGHEVWSFVSIPNIKVKVTDADRNIIQRMCTSRTDPYMTTFDYRCFNLQYAGEFLMYSSLRRPSSVHVMQTCCAPFGFCVCGVAVRNENAIFTANFCGHITTHYVTGQTHRNNYIEAHICDDTHMKVIKEGDKKYKVVLPGGTNVSLEYRKKDGHVYFNSVRINPSLEDIGNVEGLCGNFDNNNNNDYRNRKGEETSFANFVEEWRVTNNSLFVNVSLRQESAYSPRQYCTCNNITATIDCNRESEFSERCTTTNEGIYSAFLKTCSSKMRNKRSVMSSVRRYKRELSSNGYTIDKVPLTFDPDFKDKPQEAHWTNGWTEEKALSFCQSLIKDNRATTLCSEVLQNFTENVNNSIQECVEDIKLSGGTDFSSGTLDAVIGDCVEDAVRIENLTTQSSSGNSSKSLLDEILDVACQNNCSGVGNCSLGVCECEEGYEGTDCSLQLSTPPSIIQPVNTALCKIETEECNEYTIPGSDFSKTNLTCRARKFKVFSNKTDVSNEALTFPGTYLSDFVCKCILPSDISTQKSSDMDASAEGYHISVSNDGIEFSKEIHFMNYNSLCYDCSVGDMSCIKLETCPRSTIEDEEKGDKETKSRTSTVAAVLVVVVLLLVVIAFVTYVKCYKKKNPSMAFQMQKYTNAELSWESERHSTSRPTSADSVASTSHVSNFTS